MQESFLFFIWQHRLFHSEAIQTTDGRTIEVCRPGVINTDAGPDFLNAQIRIDEVLWGGQVEMHIKSSDWFKHGHDTDPAYENVILHVVWEHDKEVCRMDRTRIPVLEIAQFSSLHFYEKFQEMSSRLDLFFCSSEISQIPELTRIQWLDRSLVSRMEEVSDRVLTQLEELKGDWSELVFRSLFRSLGLKVNAQAMELLAESIPYKLIARYRNRPHAIEALLFGQSALLDDENYDDYPKLLKSEYNHLQRLYKLNPLNQGVFRFMRMHPSSFPTLRLAQLAAILRSVYPLTTLLDTKFQHESLLLLLDQKPHHYWKNHYRFNVETLNKSSSPGLDARNRIILNTVIPIQFALFRHSGKTAYRDRAENLLNAIPAEKNKILNEWAKIGVESENAGQSQALLYQFKHYCSVKKCLNCLIGKNILISHNEYDSTNN